MIWTYVETVLITAILVVDIIVALRHWNTK